MLEASINAQAEWLKKALLSPPDLQQASTSSHTQKQHTGHWLMVGQRENTLVYYCHYYYHPYHYFWLHAYTTIREKRKKERKKAPQKNQKKQHIYAPEVSCPPSELHSSPHVSLSQQMVSEFQQQKKGQAKKIRSQSKTLS